MYKKKYKSVYISILTVGFYIFNILLYIIYIIIIVIYKKVYFEKQNGLRNACIFNSKYKKCIKMWGIQLKFQKIF